MFKYRPLQTRLQKLSLCWMLLFGGAVNGPNSLQEKNGFRITLTENTWSLKNSNSWGGGICDGLQAIPDWMLSGNCWNLHTLCAIQKVFFDDLFNEWKTKRFFLLAVWSVGADGKSHNVHKKLRCAYHCLKRNMCCLWTFEYFSASTLINKGRSPF